MRIGNPFFTDEVGFKMYTYREVKKLLDKYSLSVIKIKGIGAAIPSTRINLIDKLLLKFQFIERILPKFIVIKVKVKKNDRNKEI